MAKLSYSVAIFLIWAAIMMMGSSLTVEASGDLPWITPITGLVSGDEEFELDSEINRRILATSNYISYGALQRNTVPCSRRGASYYNCQPGAQSNPYSRGCSAITRLRRPEEEQSLKYLGFVQNAAVGAGVCVSNLYGYAKDRPGPLKNGVESVEGKVKTVVGPVYEKYHEAPAQILTFVDRKVDESVTKAAKLDVRPVIKQASGQALSAAQKAPEAACTATKSVYSYEPKAEECAASAWRKLNELPVFPKVAGVVVPAAAYCSEKYNETVQHTAEKGYMVASHLPLDPTERIAEVFGEKVPEPEPVVAVSHGETDVAVH